MFRSSEKWFYFRWKGSGVNLEFFRNDCNIRRETQRNDSPTICCSRCCLPSSFYDRDKFLVVGPKLHLSNYISVWYSRMAAFREEFRFFGLRFRVRWRAFRNARAVSKLFRVEHRARNTLKLLERIQKGTHEIDETLKTIDPTEKNSKIHILFALRIKNRFTDTRIVNKFRVHR